MRLIRIVIVSFMRMQMGVLQDGLGRQAVAQDVGELGVVEELGDVDEGLLAGHHVFEGLFEGL
jgi:hypothetical protein